MKKFQELQARYRDLEAKKCEFAAIAKKRELTDDELAELRSINAEMTANVNERMSMSADAQYAAAQPKTVKSANQQMREYVQSVRNHSAESEVRLRTDSQNTITSSVIAPGDVNNMTSAGIPLTINDLLNPLEMKTIYEALGMKVATGVRGQIVWPHLNNAVEATVGGELADAGVATLDFSKITAVPQKVGISISVSNEAINDEGFDLVGTIVTQMNKGIGRVINSRVLALTAPASGAALAGPLVGIASKSAQCVSFATAGAPTYAEVKALKGKVFATGAEMSGFCYVMDAAMFSLLETTPKDAGSGLFVIQDGKIDGDPVFVTSLAAYAGKIVAGCFGYEALCQHGPAYFIIDPYTLASKNSTKFTLNLDFSLTDLETTPFAYGA